MDGDKMYLIFNKYLKHKINVFYVINICEKLFHSENFLEIHENDVYSTKEMFQCDLCENTIVHPQV